MLAQSLIADNYILPELQLFINGQSWADAAKVCQQAGQLLLLRNRQQQHYVE